MRNPLRVLMVEDSADDAELIALALRRDWKLLVYDRVDTPADLQMSLRSKPYDIVLADNAMPHLSGQDALQIATDVAPEIPVVVVSGTLSEDMAVDALRKGAYDFVLKSNLARLKPAVIHALENASLRRENEIALADLNKRTGELSNQVKKANALYSISTQLHSRAISINGSLEAVAELVASGMPHPEYAYGAITLDERDFVTPTYVDTKWTIQSPITAGQIDCGKLCAGYSTRWWDSDEAPFSQDDLTFLDSAAAIVSAAISREKAEQALRRSETYHRALIENSLDVIIVIDAEGICRYVSSAIHRLTGFEPFEVVGQRIFEFLHSDDIPRLTELLAIANAHVSPDVLPTHRWRHKYGHWITVESAGRNMLLDPDVGGIILSLRDITQRESALQDLWAREQSFVQLTSNIDEVFIVVSSDYTESVFVSQGYEKLTGKSCEDFRKNPAEIIELVRADEREKLQLILRKVALGRHLDTFECHIVHVDGTEHQVVANLMPVLDKAGEVYRVAAVISDITRLRKVEEQAYRSQKMEAVGRLAGGIAHDFNNLLTVVMAYSDMALNNTGVSDDLRQDLQDIRSAAESAANLTKQLLTFSRLHVIQPTLLSLDEEIRACLMILKPLLTEQIDSTVRLEAPDAYVYLDRGQLQQVMANIVVNARDAMDGAGSITLTTNESDVDVIPDNAEWESRPGRFAVITLRDTGCGMPPHIIPKIFEPFFTTKDVGRGTGLGLSTVYGIIRQAHGFIVVQSTAGEGTLFSIFLPLAKAGSNTNETSVPSESITGNGETILMIDDSEMVRKSTRRILESLSYKVIVAGTADEGLVLLKNHLPDIFLIISDVIMPGMVATQFIRELQLIESAPPLLFMSGHTDNKSLNEIIGNGSVAFIHKPFTTASLGAKIIDLVKRSHVH